MAPVRRLPLRVVLAAILTMVFLDLNGREPTLTNGELFDLVMAVASGALKDLDDLANRLAPGA